MVKFTFKGQSSIPVQYSSPVVQSSEWIHPYSVHVNAFSTASRPSGAETQNLSEQRSMPMHSPMNIIVYVGSLLVTNLADKDF